MAKLGNLNLNTIVKIRTFQGDGMGFEEQPYLVIKKDAANSRVWLMTISPTSVGYSFGVVDSVRDLLTSRVEIAVHSNI